LLNFAVDPVARLALILAGCFVNPVMRLPLVLWGALSGGVPVLNCVALRSMNTTFFESQLSQCPLVEPQSPNACLTSMLISFCCGQSRRPGFKRIASVVLELGAGFGSFNIAMNLIGRLQEAGDKNGAVPWKLGSNLLLTQICFSFSIVLPPLYYCFYCLSCLCYCLRFRLDRLGFG
jgi:hypothetical protein